ncbi:MAG: 7-cyano-7-deazaguanine synthase QueC [bacterium]|jgi:7-cyano-7-deazaguanine synthase
MDKHAVVLLSGGIDSSTTLAIALEEGFTCSALSFRYGQRHEVELNAARSIAQTMGITDHRIVDIDLRMFGKSALTDDIAVPKARAWEDISHDIPVTYVPARNIIFLSYALAFAEVTGSRDIFIGVNALDYSGYPDCRPEFIDAYTRMANVGTKAGVEGHPFQIHTPLIHWTKAEIIQKGMKLGIDYAQTISCYDPDEEGRACGACDSCLLRKRGFQETGVPDPTRYVQKV